MEPALRSLIWSYGGGTQSIAILVLVIQSKLPRPAHIVMADTGREAQSSWDYHYANVALLMERHELRLEIAPHSLATTDVFTKRNTSVLPLFFRDSTRIGKIIQQDWCSGEWKRDVSRRYLRSLGFGPKKPIMLWLGMSLDEVGRMRDSDVKWIENRYPLVDLGIRRSMCRKIVMDFGLPEPPRSSCWCCPHRRNSEWRKLRDEYPEQWKAAQELEREINRRHPDPKGGLFLHKAGVPLVQADIEEPDAPMLPGFGVTDECNSGHCFV